MSEKSFDPAIVGTLSRHAAARGIERLVLRAAAGTLVGYGTLLMELQTP